MRIASSRSSRRFRQLGALALVTAMSGGLAACDDSGGSVANMGLVRASHPVSPATLALMKDKGVDPNAPVLIRTYKKEAEFEVWKMKPDGRFTLLKTYPMCRWSGQLGPKVREGDRQVPEGFYKITPGQMNPNSHYYLSFDVGYPNAYDQAWGHEGGSIMVHGACSSAGCFSMTDSQIDEIYALARDGFAGGQHVIQMQSYPFHMTAENMAKYRLDPNIAFWRQLKEGADHFEVTQQEVRTGVCGKHYVFDAVPADGSHFDPLAACPALKRDPGVEADVAAREKQDEAKTAALIASGLPAIRTLYADGGQNQVFTKAALQDVSRPEAIAAGPTDWLVEPKNKKVSPVVKIAAAKAGAKAATRVPDNAGVKDARGIGPAGVTPVSSAQVASGNPFPPAKRVDVVSSLPDDRPAPQSVAQPAQAPGSGNMASAIAGTTSAWSSNLSAALFPK